MRIPDQKIEEIRSAIDIVDVIGAVVRLKKRGKSYVGLCPFHTEKTPSFTVSAEKQMFHCFGCGVGGNVYTFVMELEKVSFVEAVRSLGEKAGIPIPEQGSDQSRDDSIHEELYNACRIAGLFFYRSLSDSQEGKAALEYFRKRGFKEETIKAFGLGYSPNSWDALIKHAADHGISPAILEQAGLLRKREDGSVYDYFRGRAMFPIFSTTGRVAGFGARKMREDDPLGKYINSPETPIYNKSRILYGVFQAKEAIREREAAILVEGYADLISVFQSGIKNVVASSGTALTVEQIQLIHRYTSTIILVYDADSAGSKAAIRGADLILENGLEVRVVKLPQGEDPDSFVRTNGGEAFAAMVDSAVSFLEFVADAYAAEGKLGTPEGQAETVRTLIRSISRIPDELKRNVYIKYLSEKYKLYESMLHRELERIRVKDRTYTPAQAQRSGEKVTVRNDSARSQASAGSPVIPVAERDLLHAMLDGGTEVIRFVFDQISLDDLSHPLTSSLAAILIDAMEEGRSVEPQSIVTELDREDHRQFVSTIVLSRYSISRKWEESHGGTLSGEAMQIARDAILAIRKDLLLGRLRKNEQEMKEAIARGEDPGPYLEKNSELTRIKKELRLP
jgi:DNA primase